MTPVPNQGSIIWQWLESRVIQVIVSDYLISELVMALAETRFRLTTEQQDSIVTEYLHYAIPFDQVPQSGAHCRDPLDIPVLDLAIWQRVDAITTTDPDLLELDREFTFRILNLAGFQEFFADEPAYSRVPSLSSRGAKRRGDLVAVATSDTLTRLPRFARNDRVVETGYA